MSNLAWLLTFALGLFLLVLGVLDRAAAELHDKDSTARRRLRKIHDLNGRLCDALAENVQLRDQLAQLQPTRRTFDEEFDRIMHDAFVRDREV